MTWVFDPDSFACDVAVVVKGSDLGGQAALDGEGTGFNGDGFRWAGAEVEFAGIELPACGFEILKLGNADGIGQSRGGDGGVLAGIFDVAVGSGRLEPSGEALTRIVGIR